MDWFLYDSGFRHERVNSQYISTDVTVIVTIMVLRLNLKSWLFGKNCHCSMEIQTTKNYSKV